MAHSKPKWQKRDQWEKGGAPRPEVATTRQSRARPPQVFYPRADWRRLAPTRPSVEVFPVTGPLFPSRLGPTHGPAWPSRPASRRCASTRKNQRGRPSRALITANPHYSKGHSGTLRIKGSRAGCASTQTLDEGFRPFDSTGRIDPWTNHLIQTVEFCNDWIAAGYSVTESAARDEQRPRRHGVPMLANARHGGAVRGPDVRKPRRQVDIQITAQPGSCQRGTGRA